MPLIEELDSEQIHRALTDASRRQVPVALSCRIGSAWHGVRTRMIRKCSQEVYLQYADPGEEPAPDLPPSTPVSLAFKLGHHKHMFNALVEDDTECVGPDGVPARALRVSVPERMYRVQRRAYHRVDVPRSRSVLVNFWEGPPAQISGEDGRTCLSWEGWLTNLSAGGFQVRLASGSAPKLEVGDVVGLRISLGQEFRPIEAEAQFRHQVCDDRGVTLLGFQFVGLHESPAGRKTLLRIGQVVCDFQRLCGRRRGRAHEDRRAEVPSA